MFTLIHKKKNPGNEGDQISDKFIIRYVRVILGSLAPTWE